LDSADLEGACGCYEKGSQLVMGLWGLGPWLYVSIIKPSISFASLVWWPGSQTASYKKRLSRVQRLACLGTTRAICTTPTDGKQALTGLPPLDLVIQGEAWSAAHRLWSVGCWSCLHPNRGHSTLTRLQKSEPVFTIGVNVMRPAFNLEPKYSVTMLTREECTTGPGTLPVVKGLVRFKVGPRQWRGLGWGVWAILRNKAQYPSRKTCYSLSG
jgi:hypothetical protein